MLCFKQFFSHFIILYLLLLKWVYFLSFKSLAQKQKLFCESMQPQTPNMDKSVQRYLKKIPYLFLNDIFAHIHSKLLLLSHKQWAQPCCWLYLPQHEDSEGKKKRKHSKVAMATVVQCRCAESAQTSSLHLSKPLWSKHLLSVSSLRHSNPFH